MTRHLIKSCISPNLQWRIVLSSKFSTLSNSLVQARLAFRSSSHSSSNQRFDFLGMVVALGMLSFAALVMCLTKECKDPLPLGCPQWSFPITGHGTVPNQPIRKIPHGKGHSLVVSLLLMVRSKSVWHNGQCHGYRAGPPTHLRASPGVDMVRSIADVGLFTCWAWDFR